MYYFFPRYLELNTRYSERYRRCNSEVPKYLHNKPRQLLQHCMERMTSADEIQQSDIKNENQPGCFTVKAQSSDRWYNLSFGAKDRMPSCECLDFRRNGLPCKHFFSVFKHFPEWQWESLPENYRNNPFLSLDEESPFSCPTNGNPISHHDNLPQMEEPRDRQRPDTPRDNKLNTERKLRQNQMECRSILKELTTLTYNVCDPSALDDLKLV